MRAIRVLEFGEADRLTLEETAIPEPKAGEARVKVAATGVNFVEVYQRRGWYTVSLPFIPGAEFAGVVDAVGEGVSGVKPGDRVATASGSQGYAEYAIARASQLVPVPEALPLELASAVLLQGITAHYLAYSTYPIQPGDQVLIHAAAGGVGQLLVQIAKHCGARVIGTASTEEKARLAREAGADEVILYSQQDFEAETRRLTDGRGVHVVYDGVGEATFAKGLNCLRPRGFMVLYGQASGPVEPFNPQILAQRGSLYLTRPSFNAYIQSREELLWRAESLFEGLVSGGLKVRIDRTFPLQEAQAAHRYLEDRQTKGKVLLAS